MFSKKLFGINGLNVFKKMLDFNVGHLMGLT